MKPNGSFSRIFKRLFSPLLWGALVLLTSPAQGQNAAQCMDIARAQQALGNLEAAKSLYQRVIFFDRKTYGLECYQALSDIHFALNELEPYTAYQDLLYQNLTSDSLKNEVLVRKAGALLLQGKHTLAKRELFYIKTDNSPFWQHRKQLYLGACLYGEKDFDGAQTVFLELMRNKTEAQKAILKKYINKAKKANKKKPKTAKRLSMVIPGAGQLYAGDYKNAANSFGLNALMAAWFFHTAINLSLNDAILSTGSWAFRYYAGGYQRAPLLTEEVKDKRLKAYFQEILRLVE